MFSHKNIFQIVKVLIILVSISFCFTGCGEQSDKLTIQFASWGSQSEVAILKPILNEFEKQNPNIKLEFVHIPQNYFQKIHLLFASNLAPDVILINNLYLPVYADADVLVPLTVEKNIFFKKSVEALSYKDNLYAIPRDISNLVVYYNKDIFDKYNVPYPNKYWSLEDYLAICKKLTKDTNDDGKTDLWGTGFEEDTLYWLPFLMSEGGGIISNKSKKTIINKTESKKGLKFYADLRNKYHVAPTRAEIASETMAQMFLQEKIAMQISGRWLVPKFRSDAKFNWDVINFPSGDRGSVVPLDATGWAISKTSKHKDEALKLINFLASQENIEKLAKSGLIVPARVDVAESEFLQMKKLPPKSEEVFLYVIRSSKPTPVCVNYNEILDNLKEKTEYLFNKQ